MQSLVKWMVLALWLGISVQAQQQGAPPQNQGVCPRPNTPPGPCTESCSSDAQCGQGLKCCDTGCGHVCRRPVPPQSGPQQGSQQGPQQGQQGQGRQGQQGPQGQRPPQNGPLGQRGPNNGPNNGPNGPRNGPLGQQGQLPPQPSLVGLGGCSRGATLRNPDGSTLVCGFGPRDFACPQDFSCVFDSVLRSLICCPSEDATVPPTPSPANPCPDGDPIRDEFNNHLQCNGDSANGLSTCPSGTICANGACCRPKSVESLLTVKDGQCPLPLPIAQSGPCTTECSFDAQCQGNLKCCFVGCGVKCVKPILDEATPQPGAPGSAPGSQPVGAGPNGPPQQQTDLSLIPTRNDGIFLQQQQRQGGFLGDQQGGGFAPRGPVGGFGPQQPQQFGGQGQLGQQQFGQQQQQQFGQQQFGSQQRNGGPLVGPQFQNRANDFAEKSDSFLKGVLFRPGVAPVTPNDTCVNMTCPECHECSQASGIPRCIRMPDCCPGDQTPTACITNPCPHTKCPDNPEAFCFPDGCGNTCRAVYYDRYGNLASCPTTSNL